MKWTSTLPGNFKKSAILLIYLLTSITLINAKSYAQTKSYATVTPSSGLVFYPVIGNPDTNPGSKAGSITNAANAATGGDESFAVLNAKYSNLLILKNEGEAWLQVKYGAPVPAGKTTYIRFDTPTADGLNIDLLGLAGDLTGLIKNNYVQLDAYSGATSGANGTLVPVANVSSQIVRDISGKYYFAVTSTQQYNSVRVRLRFRGNLLGVNLAGELHMNIYEAFTVADQNCAPAIFTNIGESTGLNVSLTEAVLNPQGAIDANIATYSTLQPGVVALAAMVSQTIYLNGLSGANDYAKVIVSVPPSLLTASLFNTVTVQGYNGNTPVGTPKAVSEFLSLDLLGLLAKSTPVPIFFKPGAPFDRVKITVDNGLNVGGNLLSGGLRIHEVQQTVESPTFAGLTNGAAAVCGNQVALSVNSPNPAFTYNWYRSTKDARTKVLLAGASAGTYSDTNLAPGTYMYYVSAQKTGCIGESDIDSAKITVTAIPANPAVAAVDAICAGSAATLAVTNPVTGVIYKWYSAATNGTLLKEGATYTTGTLNASTTVYVQAEEGTCMSAARTAVVINVNPLPAQAVITTNSETITAGQKATLKATAEAGNTIKWYAALTGGVALETGETFITPALTATKIYYVETQSAAGCINPIRVPVTVTVIGGPVDPNCNRPIAQQSGIEGLCLLCTVQNPESSTDNSPDNFTRISLPIGVGGSGYQRFIFANSGSATDSIRLDLATPGGLADATLLGGIQVKVMNGDNVVKTYNLTSSLLNLELLTGKRFKATLPAGGPYDRVEVRAAGLASLLVNLDIYGAEVIYPNPTVAATGQAICFGNTATLSATPVVGTTLKWYAAAAGGTALKTGNEFTTGELTATTTYYIEVSKGNCANVERVPVKVTVNPAIVFATTALSNATIAATYSKQITAATGGTPAFTYKLAPGSSLPAGLSLSAEGLIAGTPTAAGDFTFSIIATDSKGCIATAAYTLKVTSALALPAKVLPNGIVGTIYPVQTIPAATGGTTPYTYTATGLPPGLTFDPLTREIKGTPTEVGTFTVPVTAKDANGNTISRDYTIIVRDPLVLPAATLADGTVGKTYPVQTIPSATGGKGPYTYTATGLPPGLTFDPLTREIKGIPTQVGTFTIPVKVTDADGNTVTRNYNIKVNDPLVLPPKTLADGTVGAVYATETIPSATGGTTPYTYTATNLPPGLSFNETNRQITGTPTTSGSYSINVKVTDDNNTSVSQTYTLKVNGELSLPGATLPNGLVGTTYPTQTLPAVTGGTSPYTYTATGVPAGLSFNPATRQITGKPTLGGTYNIRMTATDKSGLSTSTDYALIVNVGAPVVASVTTCSGTTATLIVSNTLPDVTYKWYAAAGNTSIGGGASYITQAITTNTTYYVEAISGTAVSSRTTVTVSVNPLPALPVVTTNNETIGSGQTATLKATAEAGSTIKWYAAAVGGAALETDATFITPALTATKTYYVETSNANGCVSATRVPVTVTVTTGPTNPNCNAAVTAQTGIDGLLCLACGIEGAGNSTDANLNNFTKINLAVGLVAEGYQRLIFANPGTATDSIRLDLATPVGLADVGVLGGISVRVMNGNTVVKTYQLNSSLLNLQLLTGNRFKATLQAGGVYDRVEIRFGAVVSALSSLNIYGAEIIYPNPTVAATGQAICSGTKTTLSATANGGTTLKWYASATSQTVLATGATYTTPELTATTTYYIEVSKGTCANKERVPVKVTVTQVPAVPVVATVDPVCSGSATVLTVSNPVTGVTYSWYTAAQGGTALKTGPTFTTDVLTANATYYVEAASGTCVSASRRAVLVTVNPLPVLAEITTKSTTISAGQTAILAATAPAGTTINWYAAPAGGAILGTGATFTTPGLQATTTYYVETVNASGCVSATRAAVTVTVIGGPVNPNCNAANAQQSGIDGICILCTIQNAGNSVDDNLTNATTISLPIGVGGSGYQRLIFPGLGAATDSIRLNLETPGGLADVTVLGGIQVKVMNGTSVVKTYNLTSSLLNLTLLSGNRFTATVPAGGVYDRVEVRAVGLVSALINLKIYGAEVIYPNPIVAASGQTICAGTSTTLSASAQGGTTLRWYSAAVGGTLLKTGENFITPELAVTTTYYIEVSKGSCANKVRVPVKVTVTTAPAAPVVAAVSPVCAGSTAVLSVSNPVAGATYNWYATAMGGTPLGNGTSYTTLKLTANTTYYVEAASGSCVSATRTAVPVTVTPLPALPQIQPSTTTVNAGQTVILTASPTDANIEYNWYTSANSTTPVFTGQVYVTTPLTATTTYYLEARSTVTGCSAPSRVQVTINVNGGGGPNPVPCEAPTTQERGVTGVALLSGVFNPELAIDNNSKTASSLVMMVGALNATVYQRVGFATMSNIGDTVRVLLTSPGKLLSAGILSSINIGTYNNSTSNNDGVALNNPLVRIELLSGNSEALVSFVPTKQFNKIEVSIRSGVVGALTTVDLNYAQRVVVAPEVTVPNVTACASKTATLTVKDPKAGFTYKWYDATGSYLTGKDGTSFTTPALTADTKYYVTANTPSGCESYRTVVNITVTPIPAPPVLISSAVSTCPGSDVVLEVSNPLTGITYKWYNGAGVYQAGKDGVRFTITNVTTTTSYSVEAVNACDVASVSKTVANINVGTIDKPVITPASVAVRSGSPAVLTATSSTVGAVFKWYDSPTALTPLPNSPTDNADGARFVTEELNNNTTLATTRTFYVEASVPGGCTSERAAVVVTIIPNGNPTDVPCEPATIDAAHGVEGGIKLLTYVFNSELAVDNNAESASSLVMPVGALGASVYQRVGFTGGLSNVGDTIRVRISSPGKLLSLEILSALELTSFNGSVSNNDRVVVKSPIVEIQLLNDNSGAIVSFVPKKQFDGVELRLRSGLASVLSTVDFNYAQRVIAAPIVESATATGCEGSSVKLAVSNPLPGITYRWYKGATYLTGKDGATLNTETDLIAGTYDYFVSASRNGCESAKTKVTVTILPAPAKPIAATGNPKTTCPGVSVNLSVESVTGVSFNWYDAPTDGNLLAANTNTYATPTNLSVGIHKFYVEAVNGNSCASTGARTEITLTVNPTAVAADINVTGADAPFCAGTKATLTATSTTVTTPVFTWYTDATLTNAVHTGATYETDALTATTTFYVTVRGSNKCENTATDAKAVTVTLNPPSTAADLTVAGADAPFCEGTKATLTATSTTVTNPVFTWYSDAALTKAVHTGATYETDALTATTTFYVTVRGSNKCENLASNAEIVILRVNPPAVDADINVAGADAPFCAGTKATLTASTTTVVNPVFTWYTDAALTKAVHTGAIFETDELTATTTFYVTVRGDNRCENLAADAKVVTVNVNPPATAADIDVAGADAPFCAGNKATLTASSATVTNPVFTWYSDAALTKAVHTGATFETDALIATTTFYVTVRGSNKCENTAATAKAVTVTVNPPATAADINVAGSDTPFCIGTKATLTASTTTVTSPVFTWYSDAALTKAVHTGATYETDALTATTTFYVTVRGSNKCENTAATAKTVTVTVNPPATAADINVAGADAPFCAGTKATLTATSTTVTTPVFTWYTDAALTNAVHTGATFETDALTATTTYYVTVRGSNRCENTAATAKAVTVTVNPPATAADINVTGAGTPFCAGTKVTLTASTATVTSPVFTWYSDAALTNAVHTGATLETDALTTTTTYYVTVRGSNRCENTAATANAVTITINPLPDAPVVSSTGTVVCSGEGTVLSVQNAQSGIEYQWYADATGTTILHTGVEFTTPDLDSNTDYYVLAVSMSGCGNATGRTKVTVTVSPKPEAPAVVSANVNACIGSTAVLSVSNPQSGITYKWYNTSAGGTALGTGSNFTTPDITATITFYVEASTASCISTSRTAVVVNPSAIPVAPASLSGASGPLCAGSTTVLSVNNPDAALTYKWYAAPTGGTALAEGTSFTTPGLTATTTYYVESVNTVTGCVSTSRTSIVVTVLSKLDAPVVSVGSATATSITFQWNAVQGATAYEVSIDNGLTWIEPSSGATGTTHVINGLKPDQSASIRVRAKGQLDCQLSDATSLTAKSDNPLGNTIFVPNTFTPNNDGKNDILYVYGNTIAKMKLRVYNQWGQFLYESLNIQNGWDGTYRGDLQPNGVYVYYLEAEFNDGTKATKKGTITLLR